MIPGFKTATAQVNGQNIAYATAGSGPAVLLLHGFPQTHAMWHAVAPILAQHYTVVAADLRGYGASSKPAGTDPYSFRAMAQDQTALMQHLGHDRFHLVGHDRGGRTAHRLALDAPDMLLSLTVMDIVPTYTLLNPLSVQVARDYYHWFFLAQPEGCAEAMILADPDRYYESCLTGWGAGSLDTFDPDALQAYRTAWRDPDCMRGMCADYRAALTLDMALDEADLDRRVTCPALVMFGAQGVMAQHYDVAATWEDKLSNMRSAAIAGGHFFIDQNPRETTQALQDFLGSLPAT